MRIPVNGTQFEVAATYRALASIISMTNAANAVATLGVGHGTVVNDHVEILTCGWSRLIGRVFRVSAVSTNDVTLEGCNTTSTSDFPTGAGAGTLRAGLTYAQLGQVNEITLDGGEQQFEQGQYVNDPLQFRFPTSKSPLEVSFDLDDDQLLAFWTHINASESGLSNRMLRMIYPGNPSLGRAVGTGIWTKSAAPSMSLNNVQKRTVAIAMANTFTEYST
jgi:hypothetical protein